jgi:YihY family inner membrane protein
VLERTRQLRERAGDHKESAVERIPAPLRRLVGWLTGNEFTLTSSSLAFYAMISIPPMTIIALWVAGGFLDDSLLQDLGSDVDQESPDELPVGDIVRGLVDVATRIGAFSVLAAVWPATAYGAALAKAFSMIAPESERAIRGWKGRLLSLVVVGLLPLVVFAALAALYLGPQLVDTDGPLFQIALAAVALLAFGLVVAVIFALFQVRDTSAGDIAVGAAVATVLQALVTGGYLVYLRFFADFEQTYGASSLATTVLLGFWLLLSNAVLLASYRLVLRRCRRRQEAAGTRPADDGSDQADPAEDADAESGTEPEAASRGSR